MSEYQNKNSFILKLQLPFYIPPSSPLDTSYTASLRKEIQSDFLWLTGIDDSAYGCLMTENKLLIIRPNRSKSNILFDGKVTDQDLLSQSGFDGVYSVEDVEQELKNSMKAGTVLYSIGSETGRLIKRIHKEWRSFKYTNIKQLFSEMRGVKSRHEINFLREASRVSMRAFREIHISLKEFEYEYQIEAKLHYYFRYSGAQGHAYEPIVASGKNALTLHYTKNNDKLPEKGLVLIDAGARVNGYCADVTRTYAIGTPTDRQKAVHAAVEKAHHATIALLGPEKSVKEYHEEVDAIMIEALKSLGLYKKPEDYRKYFPHAISHGLGIDVHDPLGNPTHFKPGMVLTVEPGIYIPEEEIGVRIEDDILITDTGVENLTGDLPTSL